jgi:hypothetical protein
VTRNPGESAPRHGFSLAWVVVSYFLICGGLCAAMAGYALTGTEDPYAIGAALFVGAAVGGFLAGRASPHRSYLEPALAAALVVGSIIAFVYTTPLGKMMVDRHRDQIMRVALQLGGIGAAGGFLGALVGEAMQKSAHGVRMLGWIIQALFIAGGALFAAVTAAAVVLLSEAAQAALVQSWLGGINQDQPLVSEDRVTAAAVIAGSVAAFVSGLVIQMGAPRRVLFPAAVGALLVMFGAVMAIGVAAKRADEMVAPAAFFAAVAAALALVGALVVFLVRRARGRLSPEAVQDKNET